MSIDLIIPKIFPDTILSGVTLKNTAQFPPLGFDIRLPEHTQQLTRELKIAPEKFHRNPQVHGKTIQVVTTDSPSIEADGIVTNVPGIVLTISVADCAAILIYDPTSHSIAAIHSGWRGTVANITQAAIETMVSEYNANPEHMLVYISACASGSCYEIKADVAQQFDAKYLTKKSKIKWTLHNKLAIIDQLTAAGVHTNHIESSEICTITDSNYHSFRRDKDKSGRMAVFIGIK